MKLDWRHWTGGSFFLVVAGGLLIAWAIATGLVDRWMRGEIINQIETQTGARAEIGKFHFELWGLRAVAENITVHGREASGSQPLAHVERLEVDLRVISFFKRQIALEELIVVRPQIDVQIGADGKSNLPVPPARAASTNGAWAATIFNMNARHVEIRDGSAILNDRKAALTVQGDNLNLVVGYSGSTPGTGAYLGTFQWQQVQVAQRPNLPFRFDISTKFALHPDSFEISELVLKLLHSEFDLQAKLPKLSNPDWSFKYRGRLS